MHSIFGSLSRTFCTYLISIQFSHLFSLALKLVVRMLQAFRARLRYYTCNIVIALQETHLFISLSWLARCIVCIRIEPGIVVASRQPVHYYQNGLKANTIVFGEFSVFTFESVHYVLFSISIRSVYSVWIRLLFADTVRHHKQFPKLFQLESFKYTHYNRIFE